MNIGIIGCGAISNAYLESCRRFDNIHVIACADIDVDRAVAKASEHNVPLGCSVDDLLANSNIELVVNLTIPGVHAEVDERSLLAGKHVFSEKPLAVSVASAKRVVELAAQKSLRVGCAPDTVLGAGIQTSRKLIDDGAIGTPIAVNAFMMCGGHESWHPSPQFYYKVGGGPMFDMGPYYLHALITLLGPVRRVTGITRITYPERTITSEPLAGTKVTVDVPTHVVGLLEFTSGVIGNLTTSFDIKSPFTAPIIEVFGSTGTLAVPDPNGTSGPVRVGRNGNWEEAPLTHPYRDGSRGVGVADMACAIAADRPHRANAEIALHALEIMQAIHESSATGKHIDLTTTCVRPLAMRMDLPDYALD